MRDRGSMGLFTMLVGIAVTSAVLAAAIPWLDALGDVQRAQSAADAAALAGVEGGRAASARFAGANGATLVAWRRDGADVVVTVRYDEREASARATNAP